MKWRTIFLRDGNMNAKYLIIPLIFMTPLCLMGADFSKTPTDANSDDEMDLPNDSSDFVLVSDVGRM